MVAGSNPASSAILNITGQVAFKHNTTIEALRSQSRRKVLFEARVELARRLRQERGLTHGQIGRWLNRDPSCITRMTDDKILHNTRKRSLERARGIRNEWQAPWKFWTREEDQQLIDLFESKLPREIALVIGRTEESIRQRAMRLGLKLTTNILVQRRLRATGAREWTAQDDDYIRANYPSQPIRKVAAHLNRAESSVRKRASKIGVRKNVESNAAVSRDTPQADQGAEAHVLAE